MLQLIFLLALKVTVPGEMACVGFAINSILPMDLYIAGIQKEGAATMAVQGEIVFLNGPNVSSLKVGEIRQVVRPEGKIRDSLTGVGLAVYYNRLGAIQIEEIAGKTATARVLSSCGGIIKGDLVIADTPQPIVEFNGEMSCETTPIPEKGFASSIVLGNNDARELAAGQFCFIAAGALDGIHPGDRFIVVRPHSKYDPGDRDVEDEASDASYSSARSWEFMQKRNALLYTRALPLQILGDIVVVETGDTVSTARVINSLHEIHVGDLIVKK